MMKEVIIILTLSLYVLIACKTQESESERIVKKLLSFSFEMPPSPQLSFIPIFIKQSDSIVYTATTYDLKRLYDSLDHSQSISFNEFILNSFNQDISLKDTYGLVDSFEIDSEIFNEYIQNDFKYISDKYTSVSDNRYTLLTSSPDFGINTTISYIFFLNNYFTIFDDVDGETNYLTFRECLNMPPKEN
ncbi:MAG: hypothetical protein K9H26_06685 [Prolixibacteraceae bacterium]|nr:hypothetical protein [Prolixibacteraceae bacterium]